MSDRALGVILLGLAVLVAAGMLVNNNHLWLVVDVLVIAGCSAAGVLLLRR